MDEKDAKHNIPEPKTHHKITCKNCHKTVTISLRYTRLCRICKQNLETKHNTKNKVCYWQNWGDVHYE